MKPSPSPLSGLFFSLFTPGKPVPSATPVPLKGVHAQVTLANLTASVTITQTYVNEEPNPIEAVYIFPLDESAAITGFEARIDGHVVNGTVQERAAAREAYDEAVSQGQGAYLLEQQIAAVGDVFRVRVGNLAPGKTAVVAISYVTELPVDLGRVRFTLPTTVAPRFSPSASPVPSATALQLQLQQEEEEEEEERFENPEYSLQATYGLTIDLEASAPGSEVEMVESPSHPIACQLEAGVARVTLDAEHTHLAKDFVLLVTPSEPHQPRALVEFDQAANTRCVALSFVPEFQLAETKMELIFVIDCSGSMEGQKMEQTRRALQLFLRSVPEGCYVNLISFGSEFKPWRQASQPYTESTLTELSEYVNALSAEMGGTEVMRPLTWAFSLPPVQGSQGSPLLRNLFLLTDGQVGNTMAVIELVRRHSLVARTFALGIGDSVSRHLINGVARAGRGDAQYVLEGERMEKKVAQQLKRSLQPSLKEVCVEWKPAAQVSPAKNKLPFTVGQDKTQLNVVQAPHLLPSIFTGCRFLAYCFYNKGEEVPDEIKIRALSPEGPMELVVPVARLASEGKRRGNGMIHKLASRCLIRDLEEGTSHLHAPGVSLDQAHIDGMIVALGTRYRLASSKTSYLVVDRNTQTEHQALIAVRKVPSYPRSASSKAPPSSPRASSSSTSVTSSSAASSTSSSTNLSSPKQPSSFATTSVPASRSKMTTLPPSGPVPKSAPSPKSAASTTAKPSNPPQSASTNPMEDSVSGELKERRKERRKQPKGEDLLEGLVMLQKANGSFDLSASLAELIGQPLDRLGKSVPGTVTEPTVWATALALGLLDLRAPSLVDEWELMANKAKGWLQKVLGSPSGADQVLSDAKQLLQGWM